VKVELLVTHGAPDPVVPKADRDAFEAEMDAAGAAPSPDSAIRLPISLSDALVESHRVNNSVASDGDSKGENEGQCGSKWHCC